MKKIKINTMVELSKKINISRPTLSKYFEDPSSLRSSTIEKIQKKLINIDYVYNYISTRQNRDFTNLLGVIIPTYNDNFITSLLTSIMSSATDSGKNIIVQGSNSNPEGEIKAINYLRSMGVDGAIIASIGSPETNDVIARASEDFPITFVDSFPNKLIKNSDFIGTDNRLSIGSIVEYLCRTGSKPIFLNMPKLNTNAYLREEAYIKKMEELGHMPVTVPVFNAEHSWEFEEYGFRAMDYYYSRQRYINDTILCANDRIAIGVIRAANKNNLFIRSKNSESGFRIAGHDNHPLSKFVFPQLTTAGQDIEAIGKGAVMMLIERITGEFKGKSRKIYVASILKIREST